MSNRSKPADSLIRDYRLELFEIACIPGMAAWNAKAFLDDSIGAVLPYLNAEWKGTDVSAKREGEIALRLRVPESAKPGRYVIPVDLQYGSWSLPQFTEAILVL